jgi:hypothetical protein
MIEYPDEVALLEQEAPVEKGFVPPYPETLEDTGLPVVLIEDMIMKLLLGKGVLAGRDMAEDLCIPFKIISPILADLKQRMYVAHRTTAALGDFIYALSDLGKETGQKAKEYCAYVGAAPVKFEEYLISIAAQSIRKEVALMDDLRKAYADIVVSDDILNTIGPAINSGRGIFLFGQPGNGKTTIAERIRNCFGNDIYIPRTLWIEGEIVQLFDPQVHEPVPVDPNAKVDQRWVKIKRPMIVVGGELTMESLDMRYNDLLKISEAPLQMKANGGTFLIDDFGRQRVNHKDLLNRWIVPLEKRYDFLGLSNGKKIQVPFDELILFSTNLNPKDLVDDAFLRRIPYKIEIEDPDDALFESLFRYQCERYEIPYEPTMFTYLIERHYKGKRSYRACHPRDLLDQIRNSATFLGTEPRMTERLLDLACKNYFAAMDLSAD